MIILVMVCAHRAGRTPRIIPQREVVVDVPVADFCFVRWMYTSVPETAPIVDRPHCHETSCFIERRTHSIITAHHIHIKHTSLCEQIVSVEEHKRVGAGQVVALHDYRTPSATCRTPRNALRSRSPPLNTPQTHITRTRTDDAAVHALGT